MNVNENSGIKSYPLGTSLLYYYIPCDVTCCFQIFESTPISIAKFESTQNSPSTCITLIKRSPQKDGGTLPGDLMTQEILQTKDQKKPIVGQSKIKQDRVGPAMLLLTAISQIQTLGKT
jgi:hypothetical protein